MSVVLQNRAALETQPIDFEKPGLAQHYCVECAKCVVALVKQPVVLISVYCRYYETDAALQSHWRSKVHKRRCKELKEPAYTIEEAERAAGLGKEGKRPTTSITVVADAMPVS
jgi:bud site selection protein 20